MQGLIDAIREHGDKVTDPRIKRFMKESDQLMEAINEGKLPEVSQLATREGIEYFHVLAAKDRYATIKENFKEVPTEEFTTAEDELNKARHIFYIVKDRINPTKLPAKPDELLGAINGSNASNVTAQILKPSTTIEHLVAAQEKLDGIFGIAKNFSEEKKLRDHLITSNSTPAEVLEEFISKMRDEVESGKRKEIILTEIIEVASKRENKGEQAQSSVATRGRF